MPVLHQTMATTATKPPFRVALYEAAGSTELSGAERRALVKSLLVKGMSVSSIRPGGVVSPPPGGELLVLGKFAEAKPAEAQDSDTGVTVRFRDIAGLSTEQVVALVEELRGVVPGKSWKPWFPVI